MDLKKLCLELASADTEHEIVDKLKSVGFWDDKDSWKYFNDEENNFDRIGNQASSPDAVIVDKLHLLGNCANKSNYEYTKEDVERIFKEIDKELRLSKSKFLNGVSKKGNKFKL